MKKTIVVALFAFAAALHFAPDARAQSASFTYSGVPTGALQPGSTFSISINVVFTSGGAINNLAGFSAWLWQASPTGPYPFTLVSATFNGGAFAGVAPVPQVLDPIMRSPSGGQSGFGGTPTIPLASGSYLFGTFTFSVASNAQAGVYTIGSTTPATPNVGGRTSIISDSDGDTFGIADSRFNVTVVPEPSTFALIGVGALLVGTAARRRTRSGRP
jgi:hypothetical protein